MKILFLGDVVGRSGCDALKKNLPEIIKNKKIDFVVLNGENAAEQGEDVKFNKWFCGRDGRYWWKINRKWWRHEIDDLWTTKSRNKKSGRAQWRGVDPHDPATWYD